jgi:G3E family GTPase
MAPGAVGTEPLRAGGPFGTVVLRSVRPLHPARVREMLRSLAGEVLWVRGRLRLGGCSELRVVVNGAGPRLRIDPDGARNGWGDPAETVLALTGHDLDAEWCREAFAACELDGTEPDKRSPTQRS